MKTSAGFTLIELIVVVAITLMISGVAIATYTRSQAKQSAFNDARLVSDLIQSAQRLVLAGSKPQGCLLSTLDKYQVRIISNTQVDLWAICSGSDSVVQSVELTTDVISSPAVGTRIDFPVLLGGVTPTTVVLCGSGFEFNITIGNAGAVSAPLDAGSC